MYTIGFLLLVAAIIAIFGIRQLITFLKKNEMPETAALLENAETKIRRKIIHDFKSEVSPIDIIQQRNKLIFITQDIIKDKKTEDDKARAIFDWCKDNLSYGEDKRGDSEVVVLFVIMARSAGLQARYANITRDCYAKTVSHACAAVNFNGKYKLIDPVYGIYGAPHHKCAILQDDEIAEEFQQYI